MAAIFASSSARRAVRVGFAGGLVPSSLVTLFRLNWHLVSG